MKHDVTIIQARMGSSRLPGKVLANIVGRPMIWHIVQRLRVATGGTGVAVATSDQPADDLLAQYCDEEQIPVFRGSESDVLDRFHAAAIYFDADPALRVSGDCPCVDPGTVASLLRFYTEGGYDYAGVAAGAGADRLTGGRFPKGLDAECFSMATLHDTWLHATEPTDREHVTPYMWRVPGRYRQGSLGSVTDHFSMRLTVDHAEDLEMIRRIYAALYDPERAFTLADVVGYLGEHPEVYSLNAHLIGREDYRPIWNPETPPA